MTLAGTSLNVPPRRKEATAMTATHLILHQYDISPFSQKAQKMMGLKGLAWHSIEMPLIAPKPDVEALTGGYRGTPVLQLRRRYLR